MICPVVLGAPGVPARTVRVGLACLSGVSAEEDGGTEGEEDAGEEFHCVSKLRGVVWPGGWMMLGLGRPTKIIQWKTRKEDIRGN